MSSADRSTALLERVLPPAAVTRFAGRDGIPDAPLAAPATPEEAAELVRLAASERWSLLPVGMGSKLGWSRPPERVDLVLSSKNLAGVVAYEPADGTLTARAGTPWSELVRVAHAQHHLSPEVPTPERATLGGILAAGASGFDRLRHGPARHQVLGASVLLADGTRMRSGGRVVKNVTGYDLHRLWCGSHGTLGFLLEATLRLYPAQDEVCVLRLPVARGEAVARAQALVRARLQPLALLFHDLGRTGSRELALVLAGRPELVEFERERARELLGAPEVLTGEAAREARVELRDLELHGGAWAPLWLSCRPSKLGAALEEVVRAARELGAEARVLCHPALAWASLWFSPELAPEKRATLHRRLASPELVLRWRGGEPALAPATSAPAAALMQRIQQALDPAGVFAKGRFHAGL